MPSSGPCGHYAPRTVPRAAFGLASQVGLARSHRVSPLRTLRHIAAHRRPLTVAAAKPPASRRNGQKPFRPRGPPSRLSPGGSIAPKQSLGQNFLRDASMARRIVQAFEGARAEACPTARVVEVGPGTGALTRLLLATFPDMRAVEIDQRAVAVLRAEYPALHVDHADVLDVDWGAVARGERDPTGGRRANSASPSVTPAGSAQQFLPSAVIGNLPYNIVSQILFALFEAPAPCVALAVVMMQKEVAERLTARTRTKAYGILSVVGQLYAKPSVLFPVPPSVFTPQPKIDSAMVRFDFEPHPELDVFNTTLTGGLRLVVRAAFQQRRKVMRNSLRALCEEHHVELPQKWATRRPEELPPPEFLELTRFIFADDLESPTLANREVPEPKPVPVWRPTTES